MPHEQPWLDKEPKYVIENIDDPIGICQMTQTQYKKSDIQFQINREYVLENGTKAIVTSIDVTAYKPIYGLIYVKDFRGNPDFQWADCYWFKNGQYVIHSDSPLDLLLN